MIHGPTIDLLQGNFSLETMTVQFNTGNNKHITYPTQILNVELEGSQQIKS